MYATFSSVNRFSAPLVRFQGDSINKELLKQLNTILQEGKIWQAKNVERDGVIVLIPEENGNIQIQIKTNNNTHLTVVRLNTHTGRIKDIYEDLSKGFWGQWVEGSIPEGYQLLARYLPDFIASPQDREIFTPPATGDGALNPEDKKQ